MGSLRKDVTTVSRSGKKYESRPLVIDCDTTNDNDVMNELSHSPLESPPMLKKKLKRLSSVLLGGLINSNSLPPELIIVNRKDSDSTDKDSDCSSTSSSLDKSPSILKKHEKDAFRSLRIKSAPSPRRVQFDNDVTVHIMDDEGHLCTQCKELNSSDANSRRDFVKMHRQNSQRNRAHSYSSSYYPSLSSDYSNLSLSSNRARDSTSSSSSHVSQSLPIDSNANYFAYNKINVVSSPQVNITFEQDSEHGTKLKFLAFLGREYQPDNVVVKANMHGSRIRVLATKTVTLDDGRQVEQEFNERYSLPMNVDPFQVEAKLDSKGYLAVVAPLVTLAKRQTPAQLESAPSTEE